MNQNLRVNKTNFHIKDFAIGLALKQRRNETRKLPIKIRSAVFLWAKCPRFLILKQGSDIILDSFWTTGHTPLSRSALTCSLYEVQVHQLVPPYLLSVILEHFVRVLHCADYFHVSQLQFGLNKIPVISLQQRKIEQQGSVKQPKF